MFSIIAIDCNDSKALQYKYVRVILEPKRRQTPQLIGALSR